MTADKRDPVEQARRRARRTALILGLVALAFYVGIMLATHWHHAQP